MYLAYALTPVLNIANFILLILIFFERHTYFFYVSDLNITVLMCSSINFVSLFLLFDFTNISFLLHSETHKKGFWKDICLPILSAVFYREK